MTIVLFLFCEADPFYNPTVFSECGMMRIKLILIGLSGAAALLFSDGRVAARPHYRTMIENVYPRTSSRKVDCNLCHQGSDKTSRNHYSAALEKALGERNVKDDERLREAIRAIEGTDCGSGPWGARLKAGLQPCEHRHAGHGLSVVERWLARPE